jgi:hypothetical protein
MVETTRETQEAAMTIAATHTTMTVSGVTMTTSTTSRCGRSGRRHGGAFTALTDVFGGGGD